MKAGTILSGGVALGVAIGGLWYFGRTQPIEVVERRSEQSAASVCPTCQGTKQVTCALCRGGGSVTTGQQPCPACAGSGKGKWQLTGSSAGVRRLGSAPPCMQCRGTGRIGSLENCTLCSGTRMSDCPDCAGTGRQSTSVPRTVRTVRAGLSPWERVLAWIFLAPDDDAPPQVRRDGHVPLVEAYLPLFERTGLSMRVIRWGGVARGTDGWEIRTLLRIRRGDAETEEGRIFVVRNREILRALPHAWN